MEDDGYDEDEYFDHDADRLDRNSDGEKSGKPRKPPADRYKANNRGGYGNPPVKSQFKPGGKGGPGRKKGVTNLESAMRKAIDKKLDVNKEGHSRKMLPVEIYAERVLEAVLSKTKSPRLLEFGHQLFSKYDAELDGCNQRKANFGDLNYAELHIFEAIFTKVWGWEPAEDTISPLGKSCSHILAGTYKVFRREDRHICIEKIPDAEE